MYFEYKAMIALKFKNINKLIYDCNTRSFTTAFLNEFKFLQEIQFINNIPNVNQYLNVVIPNCVKDIKFKSDIIFNSNEEIDLFSQIYINKASELIVNCHPNVSNYCCAKVSEFTNLKIIKILNNIDPNDVRWLLNSNSIEDIWINDLNTETNIKIILNNIKKIYNYL